MKTFLRNAAAEIRDTSLFLLQGAIRFLFSVSGIMGTGMIIVILFLETSANATTEQTLSGVAEIAAATFAAAVAVAAIKLALLVAGVLYDASRDRAPFWRS